MLKETKHPVEVLSEDVKKFYQEIESLLNTLPIIMAVTRLLKKGSHDEFIAYIDQHALEKEIESVLRKSHSDQFEWLKQKLGIPFNQDLGCWQQFIELTERRNLFVHTDGRITSHYLSVCKQHNCVLDKELAIGDQLNVSKKYFDSAFMCVCEVGVKLTQVIWRKLCKESIEGADDKLMKFSIYILNKGMHPLLINILELFIKDEIPKFNETTRRVHIVNIAQAHKWNGNQPKCLEIINKEDWSSVEDKFKLTIATLKDDYGKCYEIMRLLKHDQEFHKAFYKVWPIFKRLRVQPDFNKVFEECYDESFILEETADRQLEFTLPDKVLGIKKHINNK